MPLSPTRPGPSYPAIISTQCTAPPIPQHATVVAQTALTFTAPAAATAMVAKEPATETAARDHVHPFDALLPLLVPLVITNSCSFNFHWGVTSEVVPALVKVGKSCRILALHSIANLCAPGLRLFPLLSYLLICQYYLFIRALFLRHVQLPPKKPSFYI